MRALARLVACGALAAALGACSWPWRSFTYGAADGALDAARLDAPGADAASDMGRAPDDALADADGAAPDAGPPPPFTPVELAPGSAHVCARTREGFVFCWGDNGSGQLGDGTNTPRSVPAPVPGVANATRVVTGTSTTCAVIADGTLRCWGSNSGGILGDGVSGGSRNTPAPVAGIAGVAEVALASSAACVRSDAGAVRCWGANEFGQLGDGTNTARGSGAATTPVPNAAQLTAGSSYFCARLADGTAQCWGSDSSGQLGDGPSMAIESCTTSSGDVACRRRPVTPVGLGATVASIEAGGSTTCAVLADSTVQCWGSNSDGRVGDGSTTTRTMPVPIAELAGAVQVTVGGSSGCARLTGGEVKCWGSGWYGQIGEGMTSNRGTPRAVPALANAREVAAGGNFACARAADESVQCWGENTSGQLGNGRALTQRTATTPVLGVRGAAALAAGSSHACAVLAGGELRCWGSNGDSRLGASGPPAVSDPRAIAPALASGARNVAAGGLHTCALLVDGAVRCFGRNEFYQLGDTGSSRATATEILGLTGVTSLAANGSHTCAVAPRAVPSGGGDGGVAADGGAPDAGRPVDAGVVVGVTCWGLNSDGQLGIGMTSTRERYAVTSPVVLAGATEVSAGVAHTCARVNGAVSCWGANSSGQLGDGSSSRATAPRTTLGSTDVAQLSAGSGHTCARLTGGAVECWGRNDMGQVGDGIGPSSVRNRTRVALLPARAVSVVAGDHHGCAALETGAVWCWGSNSLGQLGDGAAVAWRASAAQVAGLAGSAVEVAAGASFACARLMDGQVQCWGDDRQGQLGIGARVFETAPVSVVAP